MKFLLHVAISLLLQWSLLLEISAFPNQAGHCDAGPITNRDNPHYDNSGAEPGLGNFEDNNYKITFDGVELDSTQTNYINPGQTYNVLIEKILPSSDFKGVLVRAENKDLNGPKIPKEAITVSSGLIKKHPTCESNNIPSVTHVGAELKESVQFSFMTTSIVPEIRLDVTLVLSIASPGLWVYDLFTLSTAPTETISPAPSMVLSPAPSIENTSPPPKRCGPEALEYLDSVAVKVKRVGSVPVMTTGPWSYNMQPMDNFE